MHPLRIHTDGSSLGNPGPGGWAAIIQDGKKEVELSGREPHTTNNRMEMKAVIEALRWVKAHHGTARAVHLFSDSSLVVKTWNEGWKRKTNHDLWAEFEAAATGLKLTMEWVKGHADNFYNERCDALAVAEAEKAAKKKPQAVVRPNLPAPIKSGNYACGHCRKPSEGKWGYLPDSGMIRVDCAHCGRYIKFVPPTPENFQRAKKRTLVTKAQIEAIQKERTEREEPLTDRELKELKGLTLEEARCRFFAGQKLF